MRQRSKHPQQPMFSSVAQERMTVWVLGPSFRQPRSSTARCPKGRAGRRLAGGKLWASEGGTAETTC